MAERLPQRGGRWILPPHPPRRGFLLGGIDCESFRGAFTSWYVKAAPDGAVDAWEYYGHPMLADSGYALGGIDETEDGDVATTGVNAYDGMDREV